MLALSTETAPKRAEVAQSASALAQILRTLQVSLRKRKREWQDANCLLKT